MKKLLLIIVLASLFLTSCSAYYNDAKVEPQMNYAFKDPSESLKPVGPKPINLASKPIKRLIPDNPDYRKVPMQDVDSSFLLKCGYDAPHTVLLLRFNSGMLYGYYGVTAEVYEEFLQSDSLGTYFNKSIKDQYPSILLEDGSDYNDYPFTICSKEEATYAVNVSSGKIHRLDCKELDRAVHIKYTSSLMQELLDLEYQGCQRCKP